jgi:hypothetical protein
MQILLYAVLYEKPIYSQASGLSDEIAIMKCIPICLFVIQYNIKFLLNYIIFPKQIISEWWMRRENVKQNSLLAFLNYVNIKNYVFTIFFGNFSKIKCKKYIFFHDH